MLPGVPPNADYDDPMYDEFWDAVVDSGLPPSFHILTSGTDTPFAPNIRGPKLNSFMSILRGNQDIVGTLVFGAVFERHPDLRVVCVEADAGWVPHYMYRADHAYDRHRNWLTAGELSKPPSEYIRENVYLTFQDDWVAFRVAELMNVERLMWANDFPHSDATWPDSQALLAEHAQHLSATPRPHPASQRRRPLRHHRLEISGWTSTRFVAAGVYDPDAPARRNGSNCCSGCWTKASPSTRSSTRTGADRSTGPASTRCSGRTRRLTVAELAAAAGLPEETVRRARRLIGLADPGDERLCRAGEVEMLGAIGNAITLFGEEPALQFTRALGTSTAAIAEAAISLFAVSVAEPMRAAGASSSSTPNASRGDARLHDGSIGARRHDAAPVRRSGRPPDRPVERHDRTAARPGAVDDRVRRSRRFDALDDLGADGVRGRRARLRRVGRRSRGAARPRLVKLIGDSAMIAAPDAARVADAAVDLVATIAHDDRFRGAHGGIASGLVVARNGDYFGPPANLAARLTEVSEPGEILCDAATAAMLGNQAVPAGSRILRGFDARPVYSLLQQRATPERRHMTLGGRTQLKMLTPPGPTNRPTMMSKMPIPTAPRTR